MPTGGKTGTSDNNVDQWFIGFSPYYICNVWLGYDTPKIYNKYGDLVTNSVDYAPLYPYPTPYLFHDVMTPIHEGLETIPFLESPHVIQQSYCIYTGNSPGPNCTETAITWYKDSNLPPVCSGVHPVAEDEEDSEENLEGNEEQQTNAVDGDESLDDGIATADSGEYLDGNVNVPGEDTLDS